MGVMIKVTDETGDSREVEWEEHHTLLESLLSHGFPVLATCGGTHPARPATPLLTPNILQHPASVQTQKLTYSIWLTM